MACELKLKPNSDMESHVEILRYDRIESRYLTTGDFSALQEMNTEYPTETRTLVENVLKLGAVYEPDINSRFLNFYQDTTLQTLITDAEIQYASIYDINKKLSSAFGKAQKELSRFKMPKVYAQIGALDQSIIVGDKTIGICLDKYLGEDYPLYTKYYSKNQCKTMSREYIVPDCLSFYLLSIYQMPNFDQRSQQEKDLHMGKVMYAVNKIMGYKVFTTKFIDAVDNYMNDNKDVTLDKLLKSDDYKCFSQYC